MDEKTLCKIEHQMRRIAGNLTHCKRVLLLSKQIAEKEAMDYDENILTFAAYFHDSAACPCFKSRFPHVFDHALESSRLIPELLEAYGLNEEQLEMITEAVKFHDKPGLGTLNETSLLRNADGINYLGYMAVARDFTKFPKEYHKVLMSLKTRKAQFYTIIDLPYAKELAEVRVSELENFIVRFEAECLGIF